MRPAAVRDGWYPNPSLQQGTVAYFSVNDGKIWQPSTNGLGVMRLDVVTPEPATLCLLGFGAAGLVARRLRRK